MHMAESLKALIARRMGELGLATVSDLARAVPDGAVSGETIRNLASGKQRSIRESRVAEALAAALQVSANEVWTALGEPPELGRWEMPDRAQVLDAHERRAVEGVIEAILRAKRRGGSNAVAEPREKTGLSDPASNVVRMRPPVTEDDLRGMKGVADRSPREPSVEDPEQPAD